MKTTILLLLSLLLSACSVNGQPYQIQTLPSGKQIKVLNIIREGSTQDNSSLMIEYITDLNVFDKAAVEAEADEIWQGFKPVVEDQNLNKAIISASQEPKGLFIRTSMAYISIYQKNVDGQWSTVKR